MGRGKTWALISNTYDGAYIRNMTAYEMARAMGLTNTPDSAYVNVYIDGAYQGLYQLSEKIEIAPERVNIKNGYLLEAEIEERVTELKNTIRTEAGQNLVVTDYTRNGEESEEQALEIMQDMENLLYAEETDEERIQQRIDMSSWVKVYLLEEFFNNYDAYATSQFFYIDMEQGGKIYAGPIWDMDSAYRIRAGLTNRVLSANQPHLRFRNYWIPSFYEREAFRTTMIEEYTVNMKPLIKEFSELEIDRYCDEIRDGVFRR